jgi:hypothetical protein
MRQLLSIALLASLLAGCPDATPVKGTGTGDPAKKDVKHTDPAVRAASFWNDAKEGSSVEYEKVTEVAGSKMRETTVKTLKAKGENDYTLTTEAIMGGNRIPGTDQQWPWEPDQNAPKPAELGEEEVKVGTDTFKAKHVKLEAGGNTTEMWNY